ncbi:PRD domain-containing protein [Faecalibacillus intestinalis]|jgi:beta-glucoside operon transcriptional antiterminator|uniref:PRD domain-containing protein n=1 Tax=Faecalibacillus intestinalis TaxID=1982626 RepID=UPI0022DEEF79|nr:PRD domain-containing protein [Faecalibacillus intestinalis]
MKLKIIKIFNNNSIAALSDELGDIILTGSGIGFQKKIGDLVDESRIEKTYIFKEKGEKRIRRGINDIEPIYYEITSLLVSKATEQLNTQFYGEIFLAISDHIAFAIKRKKENIDLPNVVLSETKALYKKEYQLGLWIIKMIKEKTDIQLEEAEAGYIALHLVNFSTKNNAQNTSKIVNFVKDVFDIIEKTMCIKLELDSIDYARLSTHLKFLAERVFRNDIENNIDTTENIRDMLKENIRLSLCINRIKKRIENKYHYLLTPDEQTYLCIHIKKNCHI